MFGATILDTWEKLFDKKHNWAENHSNIPKASPQGLEFTAWKQTNQHKQKLTIKTLQVGTKPLRVTWEGYAGANLKLITDISKRALVRSLGKYFWHSLSVATAKNLNVIMLAYL